MVGAWVTVEQWKKFRHLVTDTRRSGTVLIDEAINMLAEKYAEQPKEPSSKKRSRRDRSPS